MGGGVLFALSELLNADPVDAVAADGQDVAWQRVARAEYRFALKGTPSVRLPKDVSSLSGSVEDGQVGEVLAVLTEPHFKVPLRAAAGTRGVGLVARVAGAEANVWIARVHVRPPPRPHEQPEIVSFAVEQAVGEESAAAAVERLWADADPAVFTSAAAASALWLGGDRAILGADGEAQLRFVCASYGLAVEVVRDPVRHSRDVEERLADVPPALVIVWSAHAAGAEPAVTRYESVTVEGVVVRLDEFAFDDALVELRWQLQELDGPDLQGADGSAAPAETVVPPEAGEERFYIKIGGSGVGDVMIEVLDCGHGQWGSDCRRKAPRALKGVVVLVGRQPVALFRCARCTKHRWRARF